MFLPGNSDSSNGNPEADRRWVLNVATYCFASIYRVQIPSPLLFGNLVAEIETTRERLTTNEMDSLAGVTEIGLPTFHRGSVFESFSRNNFAIFWRSCLSRSRSTSIPVASPMPL